MSKCCLRCLLLLLSLTESATAASPQADSSRAATSRPPPSTQDLPELSVTLLTPVSAIQGYTWPVLNDGRPHGGANVLSARNVTIVLPSGRMLKLPAAGVFMTQHGGIVWEVGLIRPMEQLSSLKEGAEEVEWILRELRITPERMALERLRVWKKGDLAVMPHTIRSALEENAMIWAEVRENWTDRRKSFVCFEVAANLTMVRPLWTTRPATRFSRPMAAEEELPLVSVELLGPWSRLQGHAWLVRGGRPDSTIEIYRDCRVRFRLPSGRWLQVTAERVFMEQEQDRVTGVHMLVRSSPAGFEQRIRELRALLRQWQIARGRDLAEEAIAEWERQYRMPNYPLPFRARLALEPGVDLLVELSSNQLDDSWLVTLSLDANGIPGRKGTD